MKKEGQATRIYWNRIIYIDKAETESNQKKTGEKDEQRNMQGC